MVAVGRNVDALLCFLDSRRCIMTVIEDGKTPRPFASGAQAVTAQDHLEVRLQPYGGFVATLSPTQ